MKDLTQFKIKHHVLENYPNQKSISDIPRYNKYTLYSQPNIFADSIEEAILKYLRMGACDSRPKPYIHGDTWLFDVLIVDKDQIVKVTRTLFLNSI